VAASPPKTRRASSRLKTLLRAVTGAAAFGYLALLVVAIVVFRLTADSWWLAAAAQYLPRAAFLLPLPFLTAALFLFGPKKLLWTQLASALLVLFPLMGFVLPRPTTSSDEFVLRVLSYNVNSGFSGYERVKEEVLESDPDVILIQEIAGHPEAFETELLRIYPHVERDWQFLIASRYPIVEKTTPSKVEFEDGERGARFMAYVVNTPLGKISFLNVHPISPRGAFYALRGKAGLRRSLLSGEFFRGDGPEGMMHISNLIAAQLGAASDKARSEPNPVVIAGDLNLPALSPTYVRHFSGFQDGFERAGWGFGYTFPNRHGLLRMWLRLDRILASEQLEFVDFWDSCPSTSDHYCVIADLQRR
jgi:endonuclease/exonuclease/phosphatase family metal-dependent hydrolase